MRVYLPSDLDELRQLSTGNVIASRTGYTATAELLAEVRAEYGADADEEDAEYAAMYLAAHDSLTRYTAADPVVRRVVLAVDVAGAAGDPAAESGTVRCPELPMSALVAFHLDDEEESTLNALRRAVNALAGDDAIAIEQSQDALDDLDLLWYDASEVGVFEG